MAHSVVLYYASHVCDRTVYSLVWSGYLWSILTMHTARSLSLLLEMNGVVGYFLHSKAVLG